MESTLFGSITLEVLPDLDSMKLVNFIHACNMYETRRQIHIQTRKGIGIIVYYQWKLGNF